MMSSEYSYMEAGSECEAAATPPFVPGSLSGVSSQGNTERGKNKQRGQEEQRREEE